jgi:uracil-DNA glycosylase
MLGRISLVPALLTTLQYCCGQVITIKGDPDMRMSQCIGCKLFPCTDVNHEAYNIPDIELKPEAIRLIMISEAAPADLSDNYYAGGDSLFQQTTVQAFKGAGVDVTSIEDILHLGVYLTTAVKCGKTSYGIQSRTIQVCSHILEQELELFPRAKVIMLMGDVAIKALNYIARRAGEARVIPSGSTYKLRGQPYFFRGKRVFPSYLQAGPSFFIEKSKQRMIGEDIAEALRLMK